MGQRFTLSLGDNLATPAKKRQLNQLIFATIAPEYDRITRPFSFGRDPVWKRELIARLPVLVDPLCIDLACGTGDLAFLLAARYPQGRIVGVDIAAAMLAIARRRNTFANVRFVEQDMDGLNDWAPQSVDVITGGYALRNAPDLEAALREVSRVLKPGGVAAFLDFSRPVSGFAQRVAYLILKLWGGLWGLMLHGNPDMYGYVAESLRHFPDRRALRHMLAGCGLRVATSRLYFFGLLELLVVRKEAPVSSSGAPGA